MRECKSFERKSPKHLDFLLMVAALTIVAEGTQTDKHLE